MTSVGMVYTTPARDRAVFLTVADIATLQQSIAAFRLRPTVAGPALDAGAFEQLSASLGRAEQPDAQQQRSVALTEGEQRHLELLMGQAVVHASLPLRIRRSCTACGSERIINPARPKPRKAGSDQAGSIVSSVQLLSEGHPILAGLTFLANAAGGGQEDPPVCERCEGVDFNDVPVTFCPGCHELRAEAILLTCANCAYDFAGTGESTAPSIWATPDAAGDAFALARTVAALREQSPKFENGFYPDQLTLLADALGASDELVCMCRCGLPAEIGRYVALLLTSDHLLWSRQSMLSGATGGTLAWRDVAEIRELPGTANTRGIEIHSVDGNVLKFNDFRGAGVNFGTHTVTFTPDGIRDRASLLQAGHRPVTAAVAAEPTLPAAPFTQLPGQPPAPLVGPTPPVPVGTAAGGEPPTAHLVAAAAPSPVPSLLPVAPPPSPGPVPQAVRPAPSPADPVPSPAVPTPPPAVPTQSPTPAPAVAPPGWYADPWRAARLRWWDGARWTGHLAG